VSVYSDKFRKKRIQLGQSFDGKTKVYLAPGQKVENYIFFDLECDDYESPCEGTIITSNSNSIELKEGEPLSYYVSEENKEMVFSLTSSSTVANVWARGQMEIITTLSHNNYIKKDKENYYIVKGGLNSQTFSVKGTVGDFINVGYIGYTEQKIKEETFYISNSALTVDEFTFIGYLKKGTLNNVCYPMKIRDIPRDDKAVFGVGLIFTKIVYTYLLNEKGEKHLSSENDINNSGMTITSFLETALSSNKICISFPPQNITQFSSINEIVYSYKLTKGLTLKNNNFNFYEPQNRGIFYPRIVEKKSRVAFIPQNYGQFTKMTMSLYSIFGFPKMTVVDCNTYPKCP
jgi:hypothetical protein